MLRATALKPISFAECLHEEGFARARRSDEDDALGHVAQAILAHRPDDLGLAHALSCSMPPTISKPSGWVHHFEQAGVLLGDEGGLLGAHQVAGQRAGERSLEQDVLDVDERQAGGDVGKLIRSEVGRAYGCVSRYHSMKALPGLAVGERHFDGVVAGGAGAQGGVQVGEVLHQEKGEVAGGVQRRVGAPAEQRDEQVAVVGRHHGQISSRQQGLGVLQDDGHAGVGEHEFFEQGQGGGGALGQSKAGADCCPVTAARAAKAGLAGAWVGLSRPSRSFAFCSIVGMGSGCLTSGCRSPRCRGSPAGR